MAIQATAQQPAPDPHGPDAAAGDIRYLHALEQKVLWLSVWMIHHANHLRPSRDGLKVGGHQASCASVTTLMTALYFDALRPADRVAVKPHASPVFHAIQYLLGNQTRDQLERFRGFGGAQSYPSRTKDRDDVDFSTGSVGLGVAMTSFAALVQDYLRLRGLGTDEPPGRMIAVAGDAEFDEGNIFEALVESWKQEVRNVWWVVDYNRQSLDAVMAERFSDRIATIVRDLDWRVEVLKYGSLLTEAFRKPGGDALRQWIDSSDNALYSALAYKGGAAWRRELIRDLGDTHGIRTLLDEHDDEALGRLMTNLGGHDLITVRDAFRAVKDDRPTCFIAYTIKGYGLPLAGHKDNHAGLITPDQMTTFRQRMGIGDGEEWERFAGLDVPPDALEAFLRRAPFAQAPPGSRRRQAARVAVPERFEPPAALSDGRLSTQEAFGRFLSDLARRHPELADRVVTSSPDVTVSTNLGSWLNRRQIFGRRDRGDLFKDERILSALNWQVSTRGQHIELGIAENNLFILLAALGLSAPLFGERLLPIGTVYDPFISRGLDAFNYACYQDARFIIVGTPSGISLAAEGGAHQSIYEPLIGMGQPGLTSFEPAYGDELCELLRWSFEHLQADDGGAVYLRLSTRPIPQPEREFTPELAADVTAGGYWRVPPGPRAVLAIVASGAVLPEAIEAHRQIREDDPDAGLLVVTSVDRLYRGWMAGHRTPPGVVRSKAQIERLLDPVPATTGLVTVIDAHPASLSWLAGVNRHLVAPLGVDRFGQSGDVPDLYREYGLDTEAIIDAAARLLIAGRSG
ncbi:MAG: transketolase [Acidobacteria bacterium]|nr:transketolase [Acidobacteriota bacterium]MYJ03086.1 transketolase [Acidobacteriota bacterium]